MSSDKRLLLKSTISQFPREDGNEPDSSLDERFKVVKLEEFIFGIEPAIEHRVGPKTNYTHIQANESDIPKSEINN